MITYARKRREPCFLKQAFIIYEVGPFYWSETSLTFRRGTDPEKGGSLPR